MKKFVLFMVVLISGCMSENAAKPAAIDVCKVLSSNSLHADNITIDAYYFPDVPSLNPAGCVSRAVAITSRGGKFKNHDEFAEFRLRANFSYSEIVRGRFTGHVTVLEDGEYRTIELTAVENLELVPIPQRLIDYNYTGK